MDCQVVSLEPYRLDTSPPKDHDDEEEEDNVCDEEKEDHDHDEEDDTVRDEEDPLAPSCQVPPTLYPIRIPQDPTAGPP